MRLWEVLSSNHVNISIEDSGGNKERLGFVLFLLMEIEDLLDSIRSIIRCDLLVQVLLLVEC